MSSVDFVVTDIFDIVERQGIIVVGRLLRGNLTAGAQLSDSESMLPVRVLAIEFSSSGHPDRATLIVDRADRRNVQIGHHLVKD